MHLPTLFELTVGKSGSRQSLACRAPTVTRYVPIPLTPLGAAGAGPVPIPAAGPAPPRRIPHRFGAPRSID